jgi:glucose/arabinose dehydrogenase
LFFWLARVKSFVSFIFWLSATVASAEMLPGFRIEPVAATSGFCTSVVTDSHGTIFYTTQTGDIVRLDGTQSTKVAQVMTEAVGNSGLLGMALADDHTAIVHYTTLTESYDVISRIDLGSGSETVVHQFTGDVESPGRYTPSEHHGGNPIVTADGTIYVGIGDYGLGWVAAQPGWNAGKIWRIDPSGNATQLASGFRNPYDLAWDPIGRRLIVPDNGDLVDDEINVITTGGFYGWPLTAGNFPLVEGAVPPVYVFSTVVAPTGIVRLSGANPLLSRGYLLGAFVTRAIYFISDSIDTPVAITTKDVNPIVDVTESPTGEIFFTTGTVIYRLVPPMRGDCNGDGLVNFADINALQLELADGDPHPASTAADGTYRGSWGCDADGDGLVGSSDVNALWRIVFPRARAARHP